MAGGKTGRLSAAATTRGVSGQAAFTAPESTGTLATAGGTVIMIDDDDPVLPGTTVWDRETFGCGAGTDGGTGAVVVSGEEVAATAGGGIGALSEGTSHIEVPTGRLPVGISC